uniref:Uncharacterized protein MANES_15G116000 n=1 Tax=Rhizophora mucronata TaxID=61149 RepID=A0A2P2MBR5_RHIMU
MALNAKPSDEICILKNNLALLQNKHMPGNKNNCGPLTPRTRLERLLRERELRRSNRLKVLNGEIGDPVRETEISANDPVTSDTENWVAINEEELLEVIDQFERPDGRPSKQRLLVVANRLPVSALRRGEDSWQLEMSVGGLVSALLGVKEFDARWIGWAGVNVPDEVGQRTLTKALVEKVEETKFKVPILLSVCCLWAQKSIVITTCLSQLLFPSSLLFYYICTTSFLPNSGLLTAEVHSSLP